MSVTLNGSNGITFNDSSVQTAAASPYVLKNRIINGDMKIDQRNAGASVTPANGAVTYTLDRYAFYVSQASKLTVQQNAGSVTPPVGFTNYLGVTSSSAYSSVASDVFVGFQPIEGLNTADLAWGTANAATVTLSFWARSSLTGTHSGAIANASNTRSYPYTFTISSANTWEYKTITIAGDTTGTWLTNNSGGIVVKFNVGSGSNTLGTAGAWAAGERNGATGSVSLVGTSGATFYITGVQLEIGTSATPFERRLYNQELANCQRYYFKDITSNNYGSFAMGNAYNATTAQIVYPHKVTMRTASPTVTVSGVAVQASTTQTANISTVAGSYPGPNSTLIELAVSGFTARDAVWLNSANNGATAFVSLDTEL